MNKNLESRINRLEKLMKNEAGRRRKAEPSEPVDYELKELLYSVDTLLDEFEEFCNGPLEDFSSRFERICYTLEDYFKSHGGATDRASKVLRGLIHSSSLCGSLFYEISKIYKPIEMLKRELGMDDKITY